MQVEELKNEGLKREYKITVEEEEISRRVDAVLENLRQQVRLKGFRPGHAPKSLLKRMHGQAVLDQVVQETVTENVDKLYAEKQVKPAIRPTFDVPKLEDESELEFTMELEVLPQIEVDDFQPPKLTRYVAKIEESDVQDYLERLAEQQKTFEPAPKTYKAKTGDMVVIDFVGKQDGEPFERGSAEDYQLEIGSNDLVPGFEEQLVGAKAGDEKVVRITFPEDYAAPEFANKEVEFDVTVKEVRKPVETRIDDSLAQNLGLDDLDALKDTVRQQVEQENAQMSRARLKRSLLDVLADAYDFDVPETMVDLEFRQIWEQIKRDLAQSGEMPAEKLEEMDEPESQEEKEEYRALAERRVRLGLLLSELGMANNVQVAREELNRRIAEEARRYPGQEQQVFEYFQNNEQAQAQLRAPLYEDKVVDFILEMADIEDEEVSRERLQKLVEDEEEPETEKAAAKKASSSAKGKSKTKKSTAGKSTGKKTSGSSTKSKTGKGGSGGKKGAGAKSSAPKKTGASERSASGKSSAKSSTKKAKGSGAKSTAAKQASAKKTGATSAGKSTAKSGTKSGASGKAKSSSTKSGTSGKSG